MIVYFHEHLFNALRGKAQFVSPGFFYPVPHALGMAPAFLLNIVPYAILRDIGCDPFLAFQLLRAVIGVFYGQPRYRYPLPAGARLDCIVRRRTCDVCQ